MPERTLEFFNGMIPFLESLIACWMERFEALQILEARGRDDTATQRDIQGELWRLDDVEREMREICRVHNLYFDSTDSTNPRFFVNIPTPIRGGKGTENLPHCWGHGDEVFAPHRSTVASPTYGNSARKALRQ